MKFLVIDELSMVSSGLWTDIGSKLGGIFIMIPEKVFARPSVMIAVDLLQLPPIRGKLIFSQFSDSMNHLLCWQLWHLFKYAELIEVFRQNSKLFIDLLNKFQVGNINGNVEKLLKARFIHELMEIIQKMSYTCIQRMNML